MIVLRAGATNKLAASPTCHCGGVLKHVCGKPVARKLRFDKGGDNSP